MEKKGPVHDITEDMQEALDKNPPSAAAWEAITPLARNEFICWVTSAKKPETRAKRIRIMCENLADGKKRPCCWPGCPHRRPSAKKWFK